MFCLIQSLHIILKNYELVHSNLQTNTIIQHNCAESIFPLSKVKHLIFSMTQEAPFKGRFILLYNTTLCCVSRHKSTQAVFEKTHSLEQSTYVSLGRGERLIKPLCNLQTDNRDWMSKHCSQSLNTNWAHARVINWYICLLTMLL